MDADSSDLDKCPVEQKEENPKGRRVEKEVQFQWLKLYFTA